MVSGLTAAEADGGAAGAAIALASRRVRSASLSVGSLRQPSQPPSHALAATTTNRGEKAAMGRKAGGRMVLEVTVFLRYRVGRVISTPRRPSIPALPLALMTANSVDDALARRFLFVTGKGGVGKTTVVAALADRFARQGKRV